MDATAPAAGRACGHCGLTGPKSRHTCAWQSGRSGTRREPIRHLTGAGSQRMPMEHPRQAKERLSNSPLRSEQRTRTIQLTAGLAES